MKQGQKGFTMIELIVVIVILGILAATALPKLIDLRGDAQSASIQGVAGAAAAAMNMNYAGCAVTNNSPTANKCVAVDDCDDVGGLMQGGMPTGYAATAQAIAAPNGTTVTCALTGPNGSSATFTGVRAGNAS